MNKDKLEIFLNPEYFRDLIIVDIKIIKNFLEKDKHHGIKTMSWGNRKSSNSKLNFEK